MAYDSRDSTTGAYIFSDTGAPDIGVDPTLVSAQANDVGTRIVRANLAALEAYAWKRDGLGGYALDTGVEYVYKSSAWRVVGGNTGWANLTVFSVGWTATPGYTPQIKKEGNTVTIRGAVTRGAGANITTILTVPVGFRPTTNMFLGAHSNASAQFYELLMQSSGVLAIPTGYGSASTNGIYPIAAQWDVD